MIPATPQLRRPDPAVGVFTTLLAGDGPLTSLPAHVARLAASAQELYGVTLDPATLSERILGAIASVDSPHRVRVDFRPGDPPDAPPITATPLVRRPRDPWHLVVRRVPGGWGAHKWQDRAPLDVPTDPAGPAVDALLVDEHDAVLETGRGNVFVVSRGRVATPPLDGRILPGITRAGVLDVIDDLGIEHVVAPLSVDEVRAADEVWATNAVGGVRPVVNCAGVGSWPVGPVTAAVDRAFERRRLGAG